MLAIKLCNELTEGKQIDFDRRLNTQIPRLDRR